MSSILSIGLAMLVALSLGGAARGEGFTGLARFEPARSGIKADGPGVALRLGLTQGVPWRVFTLDGPPRLVLDFHEVDWAGVAAADLVATRRVRGLRMGQIRPGWSRMVVDLADPFPLEEAGLTIEPETGAAVLHLRLGRADAARFAGAAGAPDTPDRAPAPAPDNAPPARDADGRLRVMIDPGHGGIDPGAEVAGIDEKTLMLMLARELREALVRQAGYEVFLTRDADAFVSLEARVALAHEVGADVFVSLHADALSDARARGASVYTLSDTASDAASAALAERHDRADLLSGVDLSDSDDVVAGVLMELARFETQPRAEALAGTLLKAFEAGGIPVLGHPRRTAGFSVLKAADIPSVLVETGFLSDARDRRNLSDPAWRARLVAALRAGLGRWQAADRARAGLVRQ
jgi:N-acetylmuramoyl-L-alanine amidase